jgi:hypothetical protein
MILGLHLEVFLAVGYALFLAGVALVLELLARHIHHRTENYRISGFIYFRELDHWECPAGRKLVKLATDHERRVTSYRATASDCNSCCLKLNCTDSDTGRVLERRLDTWVESEMRRFHRGISSVLLVLATLLLVAESFRYGEARERAVLVGLAVCVATGLLKLTPPLVEGRQRHS